MSITRDEWRKVAAEFKIPVTQEGQPCRNCETPVRRKQHKQIPPAQLRKNGKVRSYWFEWWFVCPKCHSVFFEEASKRYYS